MNERYDLVIIGAGPGGSAAAIEAVKHGMKVALIEEDKVGGTCLNRGCIPTKSLLHAAGILNEYKNFDELGILSSGLSYNINKINDRKNRVVGHLRDGLESLLINKKITLIIGHAAILSPTQIMVNTRDSGDVKLNADNILVATGSKPIKPRLPGFDLDGVVTSDELLEMEKNVPPQLIIIGGGVIGVEFASVYNALGSHVTIIEASDRILPNVDVDISRNLSVIMKKRGITVNTSSMVTEIKRDKDNELSVFFTSGNGNKVASAQTVLVSVGRQANIDGLFADGLALKTQKGAIEVDNDFKTSIPSIYAIGDVVYNTVQLAHVASAAGINAVLTMNKKKKRFVMENVPSCVYTEPEIACVGITKEMAQKKGLSVKVGKYSMNSNARSLISLKDRGFVKLVCDVKTGMVLGAQMMCANATDIINEITTAISNNLTAEDLSGVIRPHPTFGEVITEIFNVTDFLDG